MWPSRHGLGVQLTYGLHGGNIYSERLDPIHPWKFSRERDGGLALNKIHNSTQTLIPPQISNVEISTSKESKIKETLQDIPMGLLDQITYNEQYLSSEFVYDPTFGNMMDEAILKLHRHEKSVQVMAYVSDYSSSSLNVHVVSSKIDIAQDEDGEFFKIHIPILEKGSSYDFTSPIKQIEFCKSPQSLSESRKTIMVRTALSVEIIRVEISETLKVKLKSFMTLTPNALYGESFSHFAPNPFNQLSFAVVDQSGSWGVFEARFKQKDFLLLHSGRFFESNDFSNFKRISWNNDSSGLLIMGREYVKGIDLKFGGKKDFIDAQRWSKIRDYKRWWSNDKFGFLLTSREIIWVDVTDNKFKRLLSWKHYLDAEDPSLRMQIKEVDSITFVSIFTQLHPLVFIFQFKFENNLPKSIRDPIMIKTETTTTAFDFLMIPALTAKEKTPDDIENISFALFKLSTQLELTRMVISTLKNGSLIKHSGHKRSTSFEITQKSVYRDHLVAWMNHKQSAQKLTNKLFEPIVPLEDPQQEDSILFQEYALSLAIDPKKSKTPLSILKHATPIENFTDFEEFDNMMEQLQEFCEEKELSFIPLELTSSHIFGKTYKKIEEIYSELFKLWNKDGNSLEANKFFAKHITKEVALSLSIVYDPKKEEKQLIKKVNSLPSNLKKIVDDWDNDFTQVEEEVIPHQLLETAVPEPIITVSQSQSRPPSASQSLLRPSQRTFSQHTKLSQSIKTVKSTPSQSQPKKKKRKIKGFG